MDIYCDSSFDDKNKIAGIGIVVVKGSKVVSHSNWIKCRDNNYGELFAIYISAVLSGGESVNIYSDSMNAIGYATDKVKKKKPTEFKDKESYIAHCQMIVLGYQIRKISDKINIYKIKAHDKLIKRNSIFNAIADQNAKLGRGKYYETINDNNRNNDGNAIIRMYKDRD